MKFTGRIRLGGDNEEQDTGPKHDYNFTGVRFRTTAPKTSEDGKPRDENPES